jgi:acetate kinase
VRILVANTGSSTLKLSVLETHDASDEPAASTVVEGGATGDRDHLVGFVESTGRIDAVGHRFVHGGDDFTEPVVVTPEVTERLRALVPLAPLHQPRALDALEVLGDLVPGVPAVACFDTAFHRTIPPEARTYALPAAWRERWPVHRFGFHGLSHAGAARRAGELAGGREPWRVGTCHLGSGSSLCAVRDGVSIDTTMGFTPLEGLVMATRSGTVDPGLMLWLVEEAGLSAAEVRAGLETGGGLAGLAGGDGDLRDVLAARDTNPDGDAALAYGVWLHRARRELGAMVAALEGLDVLVLTGGIGEHQAQVRADLVGSLGWLGARLDGTANEQPPASGAIEAPGSSVAVLVVPAREDAEIARQVHATVDRH